MLGVECYNNIWDNMIKISWPFGMVATCAIWHQKR